MTAVPHIKTHVFKMRTSEFEDYSYGLKTFVAFKVKDQIQVGQHIMIKEFECGVYTGQMVLKQVTHVQAIEPIYIASLNDPY